VSAITPQRAAELLAERRASSPAPRARRTRTSTAKTTTAKSTAAKTTKKSATTRKKAEKEGK
jgi:DNA topoisomerase I